MKFRNLVDWNVYWLLFMLAEFSLLAALPYSITISGDALYDLGISLPNLLAAQFAQATVLFLISIFTGLYLGKKIGFGTPVLDFLIANKKLPSSFIPTMKLAVIIGVLTGFVVFILEMFVFSMYTEPLIRFFVTPPLWERLLYSFYVGIVEELVLRFFLVTLLVWISWKIKRTSGGKPTKTGVWMAIIMVSFIYGLGYLLSSDGGSADQLNVLRVILLNGITGIMFGWLYWKKGLEASIVANLAASVMILVVLGSFV